MRKANKKVKSKKTKIILWAGVTILVFAAAGVGAYVGYFLPMQDARYASNGETTAGTYKEALRQKQDKVSALIAAGDEQSIVKANEIIESETAAAQDSGDDEYIVDVALTKASLLITTSRAQEAVDTVLQPLLDVYGDNDAYKYDIYGSMSWAYRELDEPMRADEYFSKIPGKGWD